MKSVYFATGNKGKYESWKKTLKQYGICLVHEHFKFDKELDSTDLTEIASDKAIKAYYKIKKPVISVDSGFYIKSLNGHPGSKVNPFLKKYKLEEILSLVEGNDRYCRFEQCIAYFSAGMNMPKVFKSYTEGVFSEKPRGSTRGKKYLWSKLSKIFIPNGESKTLAEMSKEEFLVWRVKRGNNSVAVKFGKWYSNKNL
jgi:XTP/dITP diphosphohydrolase